MRAANYLHVYTYPIERRELPRPEVDLVPPGAQGAVEGDQRADLRYLKVHYLAIDVLYCSVQYWVADG